MFGALGGYSLLQGHRELGDGDGGEDCGDGVKDGHGDDGGGSEGDDGEKKNGGDIEATVIS